nr:hypothetical protein [Clostridia bacterium]
MKARISIILLVSLLLLSGCKKEPKKNIVRTDMGDGIYVLAEYDEDDLKVQEWIYNAFGVPMSGYTYEYDEAGRLLKENYFEEDLVSYITYEYDEAGNIVRENEFNGDGSVYGYWLRIAPFDTFGNPSKFEWYNSDGVMEYYWVGEYDDKGREIKGTNYTSDGKVEAYVVKEYAEDGTVLSSQWYDADGNPIEE